MRYRIEGKRKKGKEQEEDRILPYSLFLSTHEETEINTVREQEKERVRERNQGPRGQERTRKPANMAGLHNEKKLWEKPQSSP